MKNNVIKNKIEEKRNADIGMQLERIKSLSLLAGCKAMCGVILKKAEKYDGNNTEAVIKDIREFCEKSLALPENK